MNIPKTIFIIPYRDRSEQKELFEKRMKEYLVDLNKDESTSIDPYLFVYAHQYDNRPFNRGAMKNIGFLTMKKRFANDYKDITFVFHDIDTFPAKNGILPYKTQHGVVTHYYGFTFALGGIFAIKGCDFEKSNGFPNFWGWGLEDNAMYDRCVSSGLNINRSIFYDITSTMIERPFDGPTKLVSKRDAVVYKHETPDGLNDIKNLKYDLVDFLDIRNKTNNLNIFMANIKAFDCVMNPDEQDFYIYDINLNKGKIKIPRGYSRRSWSLNNLFTFQKKSMISTIPTISNNINNDNINNVINIEEDHTTNVNRTNNANNANNIKSIKNSRNAQFMMRII